MYFRSKGIELSTTLGPLAVLGMLLFFFLKYPGAANEILLNLRLGLSARLESYYLFVGLGIFLLSVFLIFSPYGRIRLGPAKKKKYSTLTWGAMIFTSTMGADIIYWSLTEWIHYFNEPHVRNLGPAEVWAPTYPLFHWGPIPWSFYLVMSVIFAYQIHVSGLLRQRFSEICRPLLGPAVKKWPGKTIDLIAVFGLLAGAATTFTLVIPLLASILGKIFKVPVTPNLSLIIMLLIALLFLVLIYLGFQGISNLAKLASALFGLLMLYVLILGGEGLFILKTGFRSLTNLTSNFWFLATWLDPLQGTGFTIRWTIFYWSYWLVWCVAIPFFIGLISAGRSIRSTILGGFAFGLLGTFSSFIILGNYGLALQARDQIGLSTLLARGSQPQDLILLIFEKLPGGKFSLVLLGLTLLAFYTTIFDALSTVLSYYSYQEHSLDQEPKRSIRLFWSFLFLLLPTALLKSESTLLSLQSVSIITALPISFIVILAVLSFFLDIKRKGINSGEPD